MQFLSTLADCLVLEMPVLRALQVIHALVAPIPRVMQERPLSDFVSSVLAGSMFEGWVLFCPTQFSELTGKTMLWRVCREELSF